MPKEPAKPKPSNGATADEDRDGDEFERFEQLTRQLVNVPKREIDEQRDADKKDNGN